MSVLARTQLDLKNWCILRRRRTGNLGLRWQHYNNLCHVAQAAEDAWTEYPPMLMWRTLLMREQLYTVDEVTETIADQIGWLRSARSRLSGYQRLPPLRYWNLYRGLDRVFAARVAASFFCQCDAVLHMSGGLGCFWWKRSGDAWHDNLAILICRYCIFLLQVPPLLYRCAWEL